MSVSSYIGIVKNVANNTWTYTDGSALTYQNWASNEPKNTTGNTCTIIDTVTGKWVTTGCTTARPYFCSVAETASKCSSGWTYSQQTDYCYYVQNFTTPTDWKAAEKSCKKMGAHLVSIHSKTEEDFVYDLIASRVGKKSCDELWAWTGLYGTGATRSGSWTDGSPVDYPTDHETSSYYYWMMGNDASCNERRWDWIPSADRTYSRAVCKMEPTNVKQTNRQSIFRRILKA
ncbi:unnamed protein product, partial [Mesorhabditis belari]|uniref:C-type lectin domain-containing protein n=1 Tax=Mesorhabditis belari TaxID=2138241 RepID=A0AAF3EQP5_9BILA